MEAQKKQGSFHSRNFESNEKKCNDDCDWRKVLERDSLYVCVIGKASEWQNV